ncbi:beta-ketoacyl-ACP synthase II [Gammaproteobacteria bacterium]|nr:beta-ketoacyl-ACP synthase II [Gammaproteobacteria bacterium]
MSKRRVVVTGIGIVSPMGLTLADNWTNLCQGQSGISRIRSFDPTDYPSQIAGQLPAYEIGDWLSPKEARKMDRFIQYGMMAGIDAMRDSGLEVNDANAERIGCYIGSGIGGIETIETTTALVNDRGPRRVSPFFVPAAIINMISGHLSIMYNLKGPNLSMVTACTTATHAIGEASRLIEYGDADVIFAGGAEAPITRTAVAGFGNAKALSRNNDDAEGASRPWDAARDGFVIGEGAAVVALEEYEHAKARGARIYAEVAGFGMSGDAYHMTSPSEGGEGASRCMNNALRNAGMNVDEIDYVNAHGTSTLLGDLAETLATHLTFGDHARTVAVSSSKSMTGHLLGAAGAVEAVYSVMSVYDGVIPPTINLDTPGEGCDLDYVPHTARQQTVRAALSNSFGFGGTNGTLVFRAV